MSEEKLVEQYKLLKSAKKVEQMGNVDRALDLYLELHDRYDPNTSDAYERPAILLERKKRYQEAHDMCVSAIEEIENDRISGTVEKFQKRLDSINAKMATIPDKPTEVISYKFGMIGMRSKNKGKMMTSGIFYILFVALGVLLKSIYPTLLLLAILYTLTYLMDLLQVKDKHHRVPISIAVFLSVSMIVLASINLPAAVDKVLQIEDSEGQLEGGSDIFGQNTENLPKITNTHMEEAISIISNEIEVVDANIIVSANTISFALLLAPSTNESVAKDLGEDFIEILAHRVSADGDVSPPRFNSHGELYDFYSILIAAGDSSDKAIVKGKKSTSSKDIDWIE